MKSGFFTAFIIGFILFVSGCVFVTVTDHDGKKKDVQNDAPIIDLSENESEED